MKKYLESMVLASALTACSALQPKSAPVTIHLQKQSAAPLPEPETKRKPIKPEPIVQITDQMRWRLHNMNECGSKNWKVCGREVTDLFWELTKKIPKDIDRKCREDGDYAPGCVEEAYAQHVGNDALLQEYLMKEKKCEEALNQCTTAAEANCDNKCWGEIKETLEKEKQAQDEEIEKRYQDPTRPKNP